MVDATDTPSSRRSAGARAVQLVLIIVGPVLILAGAWWLWTNRGKSEVTDNAYVQVAKAPVAPSIGGRVTDVYVHENEAVKRGQLLFRLDGRDFQANVAAGQAAVADAEMKIGAQRAAYQAQTVLVAAAREQLAYTTKEASRTRELYAAGVASQQQVSQAQHAVEQARDQLASAQQQQNIALANLGGSATRSPETMPTVMQAKAQLERARLNVAYTEVVAPADGVVTRVEQMPVGSYLNASQTAFFLLSGKPWIEANFKEDQLGKMKIGQPVEIRIDAYKDRTLKGHVASFSPGTGAAFSVLPAQNATGNWVKVVQRLPVRIEFDTPPGASARAGLSAHVKVDVTAPGRAG